MTSKPLMNSVIKSTDMRTWKRMFKIQSQFRDISVSGKIGLARCKKMRTDNSRMLLLRGNGGLFIIESIS